MNNDYVPKTQTMSWKKLKHCSRFIILSHFIHHTNHDITMKKGNNLCSVCFTSNVKSSLYVTDCSYIYIYK